MTNTEPDSYIVLSPGGYYHDYAKLNGLMQSDQYAVMKYSVYLKWYNAARFANSNKKIAAILPPPAFVGNTYAIAQDIVNELNAKLTEGATN
jgi:hypothetical protein